MFGIDSSEFLLIAVVALLVIGPKDLPRVMRLVGGWVGRGRAMTRHLRSGFDTMMREAELEEMQKQWAKQNADIMAATQVSPVPPHVYDAAAVPNIYDMPLVEPGASGAAHYQPHALSDAAHIVADRHPREGGDPSPERPPEMGPRLRGDDGMSANADIAVAMTGPRPSPASLLAHAERAEPVAPLEAAPAGEPAKTAAP